jgi:hypothetical protein
MIANYYWIELYLKPYYEDGGLVHKLYSSVPDLVVGNLGNVVGHLALEICHDIQFLLTACKMDM